MSNVSTTNAVFRNGVFVPEEPVLLPEGTEVRLTLETFQTIEADEDLRKLGQETEYFAAHQTELQRHYPNQYVAIHNGEVIDHDDDRFALSLRLLEAGNEEAILVKHVDDQPIKEYFIRSPRLERNT